MENTKTINRIIKNPPQLRKNTIPTTIYLPFLAKRYLIPEATSVDILEQLIISLAELKSKDDLGIGATPFDKLKKIGFPAELLNSVEQVMKDTGIIDEKGALLINETASNADVTKTSVVYVFKDASNDDGDVVPDFSIEDFQTRSVEVNLDKEFVVKYVDTTPEISPFQLRDAIETFKRNFNNNGAETFIDTEKNSDAEELDEDAEISWEAETSFVADPKTPAIQNSDDIKNIQPYDDISRIVYFATNIYVDIDSPDRVYMQSPFYEELTPRFDKLFLRLQKNNPDLKNFVEKFFEATIEKAKNTYAFNNELDIELFKLYPQIFNDEKYANLKQEIEGMKRAENRIIGNNETDYDTFYMRCNRVLEGIVKQIIKKLSAADKSNISSNIHSADFRYQIQTLIDEFGLQDCEKYQGLAVETVKGVLRGNNSLVKAGMLVLLFDAYFNQRDATANLFRIDPLILNKAAYLVDVRNKFAGHHFDGQEFDENDEREFVKKVMELADEVITLLVGNCIVNWR